MRRKDLDSSQNSEEPNCSDKSKEKNILCLYTSCDKSANRLSVSQRAIDRLTLGISLIDHVPHKEIRRTKVGDVLQKKPSKHWYDNFKKIGEKEWHQLAQDRKQWKEPQEAYV